MDQSNGNRAKTRRFGEAAARFRHAVGPALRLRLALALLLGLAPGPVLASGGHDAPPAAPPPAAEPPPPPPPPEPRRPPPDVRAPIDGAIATPMPKTRVRWLADPTTGTALGGYDPVLYFLEDRPVMGDQRHQYDWGGTTWMFKNEGDLAAFRAAPQVYAPLFAGRCAFGIAQGRPTEGSPLHHLVWRGRLLLFADATSRVAFLTDPDRLLAEAERRWPELAAGLP